MWAVFKRNVLFLERLERKSERGWRKVQLGGQGLIFYFSFILLNKVLSTNLKMKSHSKARRTSFGRIKSRNLGVWNVRISGPLIRSPFYFGVVMKRWRPKRLKTRGKTLHWGGNTLSIWGITKPLQKMKFLALYSKSVQLKDKPFAFRVLNSEQGTSFLGRVWWFLKSKVCCGPTTTFPL